MAFRGRLNLAISQGRKRDGKKGRRFKTVESGLPDALTRSAVHVWELQVGVREARHILEEYMGYMSFLCLQSSSVGKELSLRWLNKWAECEGQERTEREEE